MQLTLNILCEAKLLYTEIVLLRTAAVVFIILMQSFVYKDEKSHKISATHYHYIIVYPIKMYL